MVVTTYGDDCGDSEAKLCACVGSSKLKFLGHNDSRPYWIEWAMSRAITPAICLSCQWQGCHRSVAEHHWLVAKVGYRFEACD